MLILIYLTACIGVGLLGKNRKLGFWGYFFGSVILTPLFGLAMVLASDPVEPETKPKQYQGN